MSPSEKNTSFILRSWQYFLNSQSLKYLFSSCVAFVIDYVLLLILEDHLPGVMLGDMELGPLELGAAIAWIFSSLTNFFLNRNFVFRSSTPLRVALPEYYGLAGVVFLLKTYVLLELLCRVVHLNLEIAKPLAEVAFYLINYFIQKAFIFKKKNTPEGQADDTAG